ncbi:glycoside hydrolase family 3 N-terminal domain-containing protein [Cellulomonas sp. KRMCY2]|uniref:glycoside hydrolase family 3 N-terminal domain-containing protein n=1 Tax=Cellulomonas sp. KRMCY2 TaxID=1304865 RepID=UPI00045E6EC5|nr:glycoside hydrolase family 3 N-terminal domain-containing protein [Cellulomonas sp. KRMCY2]
MALTTGATARIDVLLQQMTLPEKVAQLVGAWIGIDPSTGAVAPAQNENMPATTSWEAVSADGLGHITRLYGTRPVTATEGRTTLRELQADLRARTRHGIGAIAHEECLTGVAAWQATTFPSPPAYGSTWDPELIEQVGAAIGESMRALEVHQGLAPLLDVVQDPRWGRVEECFGEDPYLVGTLGAAFVRGIEGAGIIATLKHFVGYPASQGGRNLGPVHIGPRELAEVLLYPFEVALREGGARSVMPSYSEIDQVPTHGDASLLTDLLRDAWGFSGTVVADYFGVNFLQTLHGVSASKRASAERALTAGVDIELPSADCYLALADGELDPQVAAALDVALRRVLTQKAELGLLDPPTTDPPGADDPIDLNPPAHAALARQVAEESVILLANTGALPLVTPATVAVIGPNADSGPALLGDYSFTNHVEVHHPDIEPGLVIPTVLEALRSELPGSRIVHATGCDVRAPGRAGFAEAVEAATDADVAVMVMGDRAGLFGRGTVGEGCDTDTLELPGEQRALVEAVLATGTPVVLVLITGRPYALDWATDRAAAIVQAWFPGQDGASAVAGVLTGRVNPSGRTSLSFPRSAGMQPMTYRHVKLAGKVDVTNLDPTPVFPFGHGGSYTTFEHTDLRLSSDEIATDGTVEVTVRVTNTGDRAGTEVAQLYLHDVVAPVTRPAIALVGYARVDLAAGRSRDVTWRVHADRLAWVGTDHRWTVAPHEGSLSVGASSGDLRATRRLAVTGPVRSLGHDRVLTTPVEVR